MKINRIEAITPVSRIEPVRRIEKITKVSRTNPINSIKKKEETAKVPKIKHNIIRDENRGKYVDITIGDPVFTYLLNIKS